MLFIAQNSHFIELQGNCYFELQMSASFGIKEWYWITGVTVIESKNQVVICGRKNESSHSSLCTFKKNMDEELVETRMDAPCQHGSFVTFYNLITVVQNEKELIAICCLECRDIKVVDVETKQVTPVFKFHSDPWFNCSGPNGSCFVSFLNGNILQLDSSFNILNNFSVW